MSIEFRLLASGVVIAGVLTGCGGGGGGGGGGDSTPAPTSTTLNGVASKGPLKNALVTAYPVSAAGEVGSTEITHETTGPTGAYSLDLGSYTGTVELVVSGAGATSDDEASGNANVPLPADFVLHANTVVNATGGSQIQDAAITTFTELAHNIARDAGGLTAGNIGNANGVVFALTGFDPVATVPLAANVAPAAGATDAQRRYALFNAAVSRLASVAPQTADLATRACFTAAGTDLGKKIACAAQQIASSVTVAGSGEQAATTVNTRLAGLSAALVGVSADTAINKTGTTITTTDSAFKTLDGLEAAAKAGTPPPIRSGTVQGRSDVASAKQFLSGLRSNTAALQSGPLGTGILDGVKAFGDSLRSEAVALTLNTAQVVQLGDIAQSLWINFKNGTSGAHSPAITGFPGGCTVYQGSFPTQFGGAAGASGQRYVSGAVPAAASGDASWVGCSVNSGSLLSNGTRRYRQTVLYNMSASADLSNVPYIAATRAEFIDTGVTYLQNLTPTLSGIAGFVRTNGDLSGFKMTGDLPPPTTSTGVLLAARYPVDINGAITTLANGDFSAVFSRGSIKVVAVGAAEPGLSIDFSPGGTSVAVVPPDVSSAAQRAAAMLNLAASISDAKGRMAGTLLIDQLSLDTTTGAWVVVHAKFTGEVAAAPIVAGQAGALVTFLSGSLETTGGSTPVVHFSGSLTLPNRPAATLTVTVTETSTVTGALSLEGRYEQGGTIVTINGSKDSTRSTATFADSSGVSTTVSSQAATANVTVGGRQTATIDKSSNRITYSDGTFESVF
jgi:hypothetical protein